MPRSWNDPGGTFDPRLPDGPSGAGFSILLLDLLPHPNNYGAISTFRRLRTALWPACFPVYASSLSFHHPEGLLVSRNSLVTRCLPRSLHGLADSNATLGSDYWLGVITTGLSPDKKRLAWLGAQRLGTSTAACTHFSRLAWFDVGCFLLLDGGSYVGGPALGEHRDKL